MTLTIDFIDHGHFLSKVLVVNNDCVDLHIKFNNMPYCGHLFTRFIGFIAFFMFSTYVLEGNGHILSPWLTVWVYHTYQNQILIQKFTD